MDTANCKVVILAGGLGSRLAEETEVRPKPMVNIGGQPILWHIMKHFAHYGLNEFIVALGYKGESIKRYFLDYAHVNCSFTVDLPAGQVTRKQACTDHWKVHLVDTGLETNTGGRVKRIADYLDNAPFVLTYGDGVADIHLPELLRFHKSHGRLATVTAVRPPARFGELISADGRVVCFNEKPQLGEGWINGGFFVLQPEVLEFIAGDDVPWEGPPIERLVMDGQLMAYHHRGFWQCMDTLRDKRQLESLWSSGEAPWRVWT